MELVRNITALFSWFFIPEIGKPVPSFKERLRAAKEKKRLQKLAIMNSFQRLASRDIGAPSPMDVYTELQHSRRFMKRRDIEKLLGSLVRQGMIQRIGRTNYFYALSDKGLSYLDTHVQQ